MSTPFDRVTGLAESEAAAALDLSRYVGLVSKYFPAAEVDHALCLLSHEILGAQAECPGQDPEACVRVLGGDVGCPDGVLPGPGTASGLFGILDTCWDPTTRSDRTPFIESEWDARFDVETNIWMASVVWSIGGWRAWPSCGWCMEGGVSICAITGGPIPFPRHPVPGSVGDGFNPTVPLIAGTLLLLSACGLAHLEARGGRL